MSRRFALQIVGAGAVLTAASLLGGCRGDRSDSPPRSFFPDMDDQPKLKAQSKSAFFKEYEEPGSHRSGGHDGHAEGPDPSKMFGRGMREPVPHTVAFAKTSKVASDGTANFMGKDFGGRTDLLKADDSFFIGYTPVLDAQGNQVMNPDGTEKRTYLDFIPVPVTKELIAVGREKYEIFCIVCHGGVGDGKGMVGQRWSYALPDYHDPKYAHGAEKGQDGYLFSVIREGVPNVGGPYPYKMRPYDTKVSEYESWAIVAYIRALREARAGTMNDVPADKRDALKQVNTNPAPAAAPSGAAATGGASSGGGL
ncbi:MAG: cytochrome c [Planctomycetes bacterium]|nr:cytochrome c [Planctomycetota bacterium]